MNKLLDPKCVHEKMLNVYTCTVSEFDLSEKAQGKVGQRDFKLT